ncbi:AzlD domain-containing protein [Rhodoferax sp.]
MLVGAAPFGMIFGALVGTTQLAPWQGQMMSLSVFAGSSQFIAIGLLAGQAGLGVITVFIKAIIFILGDRVVFSPMLRQALSFVPVTVLTAIIVPMVLAPQGKGLELSWHNPQLVAAIAAVIVCAATRQQLLTIMVGLAVFFGWQYGLG